MGPESEQAAYAQGQFFDEMSLAKPWADLLARNTPQSPRVKTARPPVAHETMLRIYFVQQWFGLSDLAKGEALFKIALLPGLSRDLQCLAPAWTGPHPAFSSSDGATPFDQKIQATVNATLIGKGLILLQGTVAPAAT